ncbi:unnamed protein product [Laminaria digitata]
MIRVFDDTSATKNKRRTWRGRVGVCPGRCLYGFRTPFFSSPPTVATTLEHVRYEVCSGGGKEARLAAAAAAAAAAATAALPAPPRPPPLRTTTTTTTSGWLREVSTLVFARRRHLGWREGERAVIAWSTAVRRTHPTAIQASYF